MRIDKVTGWKMEVHSAEKRVRLVGYTSGDIQTPAAIGLRSKPGMSRRSGVKWVPRSQVTVESTMTSARKDWLGDKKITILMPLWLANSGGFHSGEGWKEEEE